jgi:hypothetical protein
MHHLLVELVRAIKCTRRTVCAECEMAPRWGLKAKLPRAEAIIGAGAALKKHRRCPPADAERAEAIIGGAGAALKKHTLPLRTQNVPNNK